MKEKKYILSPCGTSLLTNHAQGKEKRELIFKYANEKNRDNVPEEDRGILTALIENISKKIEKASYQQAIKMSAELNGIVQIYDGSILGSNDFHLLLSTDTWLGKETAKLVEKWLKSKNSAMITSIHRQTDLQTKEMVAFQLSLSELVKKFYKELPQFSESGYKIIFNLTGGFKSVQGFLQSVANFFADETVYIFETSSELMKIPRLPVRMDATRIVEENMAYFRNLAVGVPIFESVSIPETLLLTIDGETSLSPWGELLWSESKDQIYKKRLWPSPRPQKIKYGNKFEKDINSLPPERQKLVNERIDQLNRHLNHKDYNPASLDFKLLKGRSMEASTHEMDAWADLDAKRIFGHFEDDCFVLDKLRKGLH